MASRPKQALPNRIWSDALRKAALEYAEGKKGPRKIELAARAVVAKLMEGDPATAREFGDRIDGKVPQAITGANDGPIQVNIVKHAND
jgi:hypothetical protein